MGTFETSSSPDDHWACLANVKLAQVGVRLIPSDLAIVTLEHLRAAKTDAADINEAFTMLAFAARNDASVLEMRSWHKAVTGADLFSGNRDLVDL